jgi:hypothetical protein
MAAATAIPSRPSIRAGRAVQTDRPAVAAIACKAASRGQGLIVRLSTLAAAGAPVAVWLPGQPAAAAWQCDARERDVGELEVRDGRAYLTMPGNFATVRLIL